MTAIAKCTVRVGASSETSLDTHEYELRMQAFDQLPKELRRVLADHPENLCAKFAIGALKNEVPLEQLLKLLNARRDLFELQLLQRTS